MKTLLDGLLMGRKEPILCCGADGQIKFFNTTFQSFFLNIHPDQIIEGMDFFELLSAPLHNTWLELAKQAMSGHHCQGGYLLTTDESNPDPRQFNLNFSPVIVSEKTQGWSLLVSDISDQIFPDLELKKTRQMLEDHFFNETNHIEANALLAREVAERKQAEEALLETQERLTQIIHGNSIPTFVIDKKHRITHWNKALETLTGIYSSNAVGTTEQWKAFYTHNRPTMADLILDQASEEKISSLYTNKYNRTSLLEDSYEVEDFFELDGKAKWLFFTAAPLRNRAGEIIGAIETLQDITDRKLMEKEILEYQDVLEGKVQERTLQLKKTYEQLLHAEKLSAVGKLAASIAHEFGNPIIGIRNFLKGLIKTTTLDQTDSELLELAIQECQRVKDLISNLQNFNRPTTGTVAPLDLHKAIEDMLLFCRKDFKSKKIEIIKDFAEDFPEIFAIEDQIKQVLLNCLKNAEDAVEENGVITLRTEHFDNKILFHIQDTGNGIREEDSVYIFEPFFSTKPAVEGTGLGLSVSYGIIKRHQGNIEVTNTSEKGTTFTITLPINGPSE